MRILINTFILFIFLSLSLNLFSEPQTDSLSMIFQNNERDSVWVEAAIELAALLGKEYPDSALMFLVQAYEVSEKDLSTFLQSKLKLAQARIYLAVNDFPVALDYCLQAKELLNRDHNFHADKVKQNQYLKIMHRIGYIFIQIAQFDKALEYHENILNYIDQYDLNENNGENAEIYLKTYTNLGAISLSVGKFDEAEIYYTKALAYMDNDDTKSHSIILNNLGIIAYEREEIESALDYHKRSLSIRKDNQDYYGIAQSYNNLGNCYRILGNFDMALEYFNLGRKISEENGLLRSNVISLQLLSLMYNELGDYKEAYDAFTEFKYLSDSLVGQEKIQTITRLEQQYKFTEKLQLAQLKHNQLEQQKSRQQQIYLLIIGLIFLAAVILVMFYILQRNKLQRKSLEAEKVNLERKSLELEKSKLENELAHRNRELATKAMYLAQTNEFIVNMSERLLKSKLSLNRENQATIDSIIKELKTYSNKNVWEEFELRFQEVHSDFHKRLNELFPNLSPNEKKLCAFLRLNMTTKEISAITYQTINSITVARARLRKKMDLENDENLIAFLESL